MKFFLHSCRHFLGLHLSLLEYVSIIESCNLRPAQAQAPAHWLQLLEADCQSH